jgi:hypothetical protein
MKYAHYDENTNTLEGWYDEEIHDNIPTPNIAVSDEDWQIAIDNDYNYVDPDNETLSYKDLRTFAELQKQKIEEIRQSFIDSLNNGYVCPTSNIKMDANINSINTLNSGFTLATYEDIIKMDIRDYDNVVHSDVSLKDISVILIELGQNYRTQLTKKWTLDEKINNALKEKDLVSVVW